MSSNSFGKTVLSNNADRNQKEATKPNNTFGKRDYWNTVNRTPEANKTTINRKKTQHTQALAGGRILFLLFSEQQPTLLHYTFDSSGTENKHELPKSEKDSDLGVPGKACCLRLATTPGNQSADGSARVWPDGHVFGVTRSSVGPVANTWRCYQTYKVEQVEEG